MTQVVEQFEPDPDANALGVHTLVGGVVTCYPPVSVPNNGEVARAIWNELEPDYVPLWITNDWRTPNYGRVRVHHVAIGRRVTDGTDNRLVKQFHHLLMPIGRVYGRTVRRPIVLVDILDGLTDEERNFGVLPRWQPWDDMMIHWVRYIGWKNRNQTTDHRFRVAPETAQYESDRKVRSTVRSNVAHNSRQFDTLKALGRACRTFTPSTHFGEAA